MARRAVAIIGSFQKYYSEIIELITMFNSIDIAVTSPYKSKIVETRSVDNGSGLLFSMLMINSNPMPTFKWIH